MSFPYLGVKYLKTNKRLEDFSFFLIFSGIICIFLVDDEEALVLMKFSLQNIPPPPPMLSTYYGLNKFSKISIRITVIQ